MANRSSLQTPIVQGSRFASDPPAISFYNRTDWPYSGINASPIGIYLGYTPINVGCLVVKFYLYTVGSWASAPSQFWCQLGLYSGKLDAINTDMMTFERRAVLDLMPYVHTDATYGNPNNKVGPRNLIMTPTSVIPRGTELWMFYGYSVNGGTSVVAPGFHSSNEVGDVVQSGSMISAFTAQTASSGRSIAGPQARYINGGAQLGGYGTYYAHMLFSVTYYESRYS